MRWPARSLLVAAALLAAAPVSAEPICRAVDLRFAPGAADMQIAVWIETKAGKFVDTAYVTRLTGQFGLANRPGEGLMKTDFRWPYGRREMVLPVWAHRRNKHYPKIMMGGVCGNSPASLCPDKSPCSGDCEDSTIAYHSRVSSYEPFYCSPTGASKIDALSCASKGTFAKGAYADPPAFSLYPPRADLNAFSQVDSENAKDFAKQNDLVAISRATPLAGKPLDPALSWYSPEVPDGEYVAWIEMSQEADFNAQHNHPNKKDSVDAWDFEGHSFLGQPSVVYQVPFRLGPDGWSAIATSYAGYGSWDGSNGTLTPPDGTITVGVPGKGAGRLLEQKDGLDVYRMKVLVGSCPHPDGGVADGGGGVTDGGMPVPPACIPPDAVTELEVKPAATELTVSFRTPALGTAPNRFSVRYHEGLAPITDDNFYEAISARDPPMPGAPGTVVTTTIDGLLASTEYTVAVRGISPCNKGSQVVAFSTATAQQKFTVLHGCFVATAAYGTPLAGAVDDLRRLRDHHLLDNPAGQLFVAAYYALSPSLANAIATDRRLRTATRAALAPLVDLASQLR
ncbi:MAG: hypothetical protein EXR72_17960 [Myxococcales bacterium]|nr:hypothetical protein [Myxococcales bacterium]